MGRCARLAWESAVEAHRTATVSRPGVTTGHILLGVLQEKACAGGLILARLQLDLELASGITRFVLLHSRPREGADQSVVDCGGFPHTPVARDVLNLAVDEANVFRPTYPIGTEHLLLALLSVPESMGCRILHYFSLDVDRVRAARDELWQLLSSPE